MYDCREVAWETLKEARKIGVSLSNKRLQKIVYIAHGYFLALFNQPLVSDDVEFFEAGLYFPKIYLLFSEYEDKEIPVSNSIETDLRFDTNANFVITSVLKLYGNHTLNELVKLTNGDSSPFKSSSKDEINFSIIIKNDVIKNHYRKIVSDACLVGSL